MAFLIILVKASICQLQSHIIVELSPLIIKLMFFKSHKEATFLALSLIILETKTSLEIKFIALTSNLDSFKREVIKKLIL